MRKLLISSLGAGLALTLSACGGEDEAADADAVAVAADAGDAEVAAASSANEIDFGDDSGDWANDGECDDPRFQGPGMTTTPLLEDDIRADATDCREAFERGDLTLR